MIETPIIFNEDTDYDTVFLNTKILYSRIVSSTADCGCDQKEDSRLCNILKYLTSAQYNKDASNQIGYEENVESAYLSLNCNC